MRRIHYLFAAALSMLMMACNNERKQDPTVDHIEANRFDSMPADNTREVDEYRARLGQRLEEIETDIETVSAKKKAERNAAKIKAYDLDIEEKTRRKTEFREKMDRFEEKTRSNWQAFKQELDDLFSRDRNDRDTSKRQ